MLNSKELKLCVKAAEMISKNDKVILTTVRGVIEDIQKQVHGDHEMVIPMWGQAGTQGAIRAMPNWETNPELIDHMVAAVQGRTLQFFIAEHVGVSVATAKPEQIAAILHPTDAQQARVVKELVGAEAYDAYKATQVQPGSVEF